MAPYRLRVAVGAGLVLLGLFGAMTGIFFTGMTPDGRLAQVSGGGRILPSVVLVIGGLLIAAIGLRRR